MLDDIPAKLDYSYAKELSDQVQLKEGNLILSQMGVSWLGF